jgi:8-oxo-dGDP phosphatase
MPEAAYSGPGATEPLADESVDLPILDSERVFDGRVWDIRRDRVRFGDDTLVREYMDHTGAVAVLALDDQDRMLLLKQYRHPIRRREWEIPAGLLDVEGERPLAAAQRELAEEADLAASEWSVLAEFFTSPGGSDEAIRIYLARGLRAADAVFERGEEEADMEVRWAHLDEVTDAILARRLQNPSLVIGALAARESRSRGWSTLSPPDSPWTAHPTLRAPGDGTSSS